MFVTKGMSWQKSLNRALLVARHVPTRIFKMYFGVAMYSQREVQIAVNLKDFPILFTRLNVQHHFKQRLRRVLHGPMLFKFCCLKELCHEILSKI